jgi:hypothetical protein
VTSNSAPQIYSPYQDVYVAYNVTGMTLVPKQYAIITADGNVSVTVREPGKPPYNVTYNCNDADAALLPPLTWTMVQVRLFIH